MSINYPIPPNAKEIHQLMKYRRYLLMGLNAFERMRDFVDGEIQSSAEACVQFCPKLDPDSLSKYHDAVFGDMYSDVWVSLNNHRRILEAGFGLVNARIKELTGKSPDELDADDLDLWARENA